MLLFIIADKGGLMQIDVKADDVIFHNLRACGAVATASSEERAEEHDLGGQGYSVPVLPICAALLPHDGHAPRGVVSNKLCHANTIAATNEETCHRWLSTLWMAAALWTPILL